MTAVRGRLTGTSIAFLILALATACDKSTSPAGGEAPQLPAVRKGIFTPTDGYRLDEKVGEGRAWGTTAIQTPIPLCSGARCIHFADCNKEWATHIPVPTVLDAPLALSPDESLLASTGPPGEITVSKPEPPLLNVLNLIDRSVVYSRAVPQRGIRQLEWLSDGTLLICEDLYRMTLEPSGFVLNRLSLQKKKEEVVLVFPRGCWVQRILPNADASKILALEKESKESPALLALYHPGSHERRVIPVPDGTLDAESLRWWPNGKAFYVEVGGHPFRIDAGPTGRAEPVLGSFKGFENKVIQGALSPSGDLLLASELETQTLFLIDLKETKAHRVGTCDPRRGPLLRFVGWSSKADSAGGWLGIAEVDPDTKKSFLTWTPFLINIKQKKLSLHRSNSYPQPLFLLDNPHIISGLRNNSSPWK